MAAYTRGLLFGEVWKRAQLNQRDRSLITVAALIASGGDAARMRSHFNLALENGIKPRELSGSITHLAFYAGWPNAVGAAEVAQGVFQKRGVSQEQVIPKTGLLAPQITPERAAQVRQQTGRFSPALAGYTLDRLYGEVWRNPDLSARDRSMVTVAALIANGNLAELGSHVNRALGNGVTKDELAEVATHLAFYVGWPNVMSAVPVIQAVIDERDAAANAATTPSGSGPAATMQITRQSSQKAERGPATRFTGDVQVVSRARAGAPAHFRTGTVRFAPKARTAWHSHEMGQMLIVTEGRGRVQAEGGAVEEVGPGDIVWTPAGVRHWHGATTTQAMTHIAISEGDGVDWREPVSDEQYGR